MIAVTAASTIWLVVGGLEVAQMVGAHDRPGPGLASERAGTAHVSERALTVGAQLENYNIRAGRAADDLYFAENGAYGMGATFSSGGLDVHPTWEIDVPWSWSMELVAYGRGDDLGAVRAPVMHADGNRVEYDRGELVEWYVNDSRGIEQGFDLRQPPEPTHGADSAPIVLELEVRASLTVERISDGLAFHAPDRRSRLEYRKLVAWDAEQRVLPTRIDVRGNTVQLIVEDKDAVWPVTVDPLIVTNEVKLTPVGGAANHQFGNSVAILDDRALVGAFAADAFEGAAYVFERTGTDWQEQDKLIGSPSLDQFFGQSVSLSGDSALIGANASEGSRGSAYVFLYDGTSWNQQGGRLVASDRDNNDEFGWSVSLSGETALIGAPGETDNGFEAGAAYVFALNSMTGEWEEQQKLIASDGAENDIFSRDLSLSGDTAVIGASLHGATGAAYVFVFDGTAWTEDEKLLPTGMADVAFGAAVAVSGDTALVGAPLDGDNGTNAGAVHVFVNNGGIWSEEAKLLGAAAGYRLGSSVALDGDIALVGAPTATINGTVTGAAFVFERTGTAWSEEGMLVASDGEADDVFGSSVSVSADTNLVGAPFEATNGVDSGAAYVFSIATRYCTAKTGLVCGTPSIDASGVPAAGESSGFTISASPARGNVVGLVLYSCDGRANIPFEGGTLCVSPPVRRTVSVTSGGTTGQCDGVFSLDFNAFANGDLGGTPNACLSVVGQEVNAQWWGRDSVMTGSFLSDAVEFQM